MIDTACQEIIQKLGVNCFVETGTDKGETVAGVSRWMAEIDPSFGQITGNFSDGSRSYQSDSPLISYPVFENAGPSNITIHTVDTDLTSFKAARKKFKSNSNIQCHHQSSPEFLRSLLFEGSDLKTAERQYFFFLDAHWEKEWPLRDELKVIRQLPRFAVVIDDFFVPGRSDPGRPHGRFGFDAYQGTILSWGYIRDVFDGQSVRIFYPSRPNRDARGWVLITKGYNKDELAFLDSRDLFELKEDDPKHTSNLRLGWQGHLDGRNFLKKLIPLNILRRLNRLYEKFTFSAKQSRSINSNQ